jgi:hypothetical protein
MRQSLVWTEAALVAALSTACGSAPAEKPVGPDPCLVAVEQLKTRLGPELAGVTHKRPLPLPKPSPRGCAVVYTQVSEEMPGEIGGEDTMGGDADQQLAMALPDAQGRYSLSLLPSPEHAPGPVTLEIQLKDVTGDGRPELVSQEDTGPTGDAHRGLRIFTYAAGTNTARAVFDEKLVVKTAEGLELIPEWRAGKIDDQPAIVLDGAGTYRIFTWSQREQRFTFDEAATKKRNPSTGGDEAPPAPGTETGSDGAVPTITTGAAQAVQAEAGAKADAVIEQGAAGKAAVEQTAAAGAEAAKQKAAAAEAAAKQAAAEAKEAADKKAAAAKKAADKKATAAKKKAAKAKKASKAKGKSLADELNLDL